MYKNESSNDILEVFKESDFPHVQLAQASAGSGKTYLLTQKIVQFLLSKNIQNNKINNIVAITFTKNSTNDIKNKTLEWFKKIHLDMLDDKQKMQIINITGLDDNELIEQSSLCIEEILDNYNDLILTIDSFLTKILYASAVELGLNPDFEVDVSLENIIDHAFSEFLENADKNSLIEVLRLLNENSSSLIDFQVVKSIKSDLSYLLDQESSYKKTFSYDKKALDNLKSELEETVNSTINLLELFDGCDIRNHTKPETINKLKTYLKERNFLYIVSNKISFPYKDKDAKATWDECYNTIMKKLYDIAKVKYLPYLKLFEEFKSHIIKTYNILGKTFLQDANKRIIFLFNEGFVPTIYYTIGSYIYHYLIDEFQDTSNIQWEILKPLIEESLSKGGSLFVVGDLKQAIYGFRKADFEVMKNLIENSANIFPQSKYIEKILNLNYRSFEHIVNYSQTTFKQSLKDVIKGVNDPIGYLSFEQKPIDEHLNKGYVETKIFACENEEGIDSIRESLLQTIKDLINCGFRYEQIAILARTNAEINTISGWLLENNYTVLSSSASDIRQRKIINEIFAFLKFLNNPSDYLSFATFILGDVFHCLVERNKIMDFLLENVGAQMLYINFRKYFTDIWKLYFKDIFNTISYVPLYELLINIIKTFNIDKNFEQESHYLSFLLDRVIELEQIGINDLSAFIDYFEKSTFSQNTFSCEFSNTQNGIQLLTIHKAKGLQFDVVINVLDANKNYALNPTKRQKSNNQFVFELDNRLDLLYITKEFRQDDTLSDIYNKAVLKDNIEDFNVLYVALTRAKMQMYNFIYYNNKTKNAQCTLESVTVGSKQDSIPKQSLYCDNNNQNFVPFSINYNKIINESSSWTIKRLIDSKRGEIFHEILSYLKYEQDFDNLNFLIEKYAKFVDDKQEVEQKILSILQHNDLKRLFSRDNIVFTEKTFIDKHGNIFRMDRVVIEPNQNVYVIDYKTGEFSKKEIEDYTSQILNYIQFLRDIYKDKKVFGILYNIDKKEVIKIA